MSDTGFGDEVYQPSADSQSGELEPDMENALDEPDADDLLDTGYSPPDRAPAGLSEHETMAERLAEEEPDVWAVTGAQDAAAPGDDQLGDDQLGDDEVGSRRSGRLVAPDEGLGSDEEEQLLASDVGIDGGAASAEEAAMHEIED